MVPTLIHLWGHLAFEGREKGRETGRKKGCLRAEHYQTALLEVLSEHCWVVVTHD